MTQLELYFLHSILKLSTLEISRVLDVSDRQVRNYITDDYTPPLHRPQLRKLVIDTIDNLPASSEYERLYKNTIYDLYLTMRKLP